METVKVKFDKYETEVKKSDLYCDFFNVRFGNDLKLRIERVGDKYTATNGVDGWGNNCESWVKGRELIIIKD